MDQKQTKANYSYVTVRELVNDIGSKYQGKTAFTFRRSQKSAEPERVSYATLTHDVQCLATALIDKGLSKGKVALIGKLSYEWVVVYLATLSSGAVLVPLDADWGDTDLAETVRFAECGAIFCSEEVKRSKLTAIKSATGIEAVFSTDPSSKDPSVKDLVSYGEGLRAAGSVAYESARISPDSLSLLVFTSGTTGKGKGVMLTQTGILSNITSGFEYISIYSRTLGLLPPHHTFGSTISILCNLVMGVDTYISSGVRHVLKEMKEHKPEHLVLVPLYLESFKKKITDTLKSSGKEKAFETLLKMSNASRRAGVDLRRRLFSAIHQSFGGELRLVVCGGAPISQELIDFFDGIGITVLNGYGITECSPLISVNTNKGKNPGTKNGSCGRAIRTMKVKIKDPNENGEGEICVKGVGVMLGYYKDPDATAAAFDEDGYFRTGDCGKISRSGRLFITGRLKNLIILSNGKNVYPEEIEAELCAIPGVAEAVVYEGISSRGADHNTVVAEIFPDKAYLEANGISDIQAYFGEHIRDYNRDAIAYKKIGRLKLRQDEFPKNTLRKIVRFKIDKSID